MMRATCNGRPHVPLLRTPAYFLPPQISQRHDEQNALQTCQRRERATHRREPPTSARGEYERTQREQPEKRFGVCDQQEKTSGKQQKISNRTTRACCVKESLA